MTIQSTDDKKKISIHIGGVYASKGAVIIDTLLGSCVAVCLFDSVAKVGGMNHIFLPGKADFGKFDSVARYGVNAMELLINRIMALGGARHRIAAKAFGGAHILPAISKENGMGIRNTEFVLNFLKMEGIPLISHDLGGHHTRRVYFHTDTAEVYLKRINRIRQPVITMQERILLARARKEAEEAGDVTLFS